MTEKGNKYKCLIIDDDPTITDLIQHFCSKLPEIDYCLSCNNAIDGLKLISSQEFDILFLDYNMPELNGKAVLELKQDNSKVIMITSHPDFAVDSYNYEGLVDYLLKPVKFDRFVKAIEKVRKSSSVSSNRDKGSYFIKDGTKWIKVSLDDVFFIKSDSNYVHWYTRDRQIISLMKLKDLETELPEQFARVHRSYIINSNKVDVISKDGISIGNHNIPIGNSYKTVVDEIVRNTKP